MLSNYYIRIDCHEDIDIDAIDQKTNLTALPVIRIYKLAYCALEASIIRIYATYDIISICFQNHLQKGKHLMLDDVVVVGLLWK